MLNTSSYFEEEEPPGEAALSPGTLIFTQTNRSLHLGNLWFQPSPSSPRLLLQGREMLPTRADTAPHDAHLGGQNATSQACSSMWVRWHPWHRDRPLPP